MAIKEGFRNFDLKNPKKKGQEERDGQRKK